MVYATKNLIKGKVFLKILQNSWENICEFGNKCLEHLFSTEHLRWLLLINLLFQISKISKSSNC